MAAGAVSAPLIIPIIHPPTHRAKNHINTNTLVSIQSETAGVVIFFTLDGSKPTMVRGQRRAAGTTKKYTEPIMLPTGRVTIRAVAIANDDRQSPVVTKVFLVDLVDSGQSLQQDCRSEPVETEVGELRMEMHQERKPFTVELRSDGTSEAADSSCLKSTEVSIAADGSPPAGPRFLNARFSSEPTTTATRTSCFTHTQPKAEDEFSSTQKSRLQQHAHFPQCPQCDSIHLSDPFAGFCADCGALIPPRPALPSEGGQEHVVCVSCGTGNPVHISTCVTCESNLHQVQCCRRHSVHCGHPAEGGEWFSSICQQVKDSECGQVLRCVMCWRCGASGSVSSLFCASCGVPLQTPPSIIAGGQPSASHDAMWRAAPAEGTASNEKEAPSTVDQHTQTVGLYYPSATKLQRKEQQEVLRLNREQMSRDHHPPQSAVSPGRGFWRKQLDHVCAHLRSYTQNHASFRAVLGEPRLGRVVSAVVREDGSEVSLTVSFESVKHEQMKVRSEGGSIRRVGGTGCANTLSSVMERSNHRGDGLTLNHTPQVKDWQLLEDLGPLRDSVSTVQGLLDQV